MTHEMALFWILVLALVMAACPLIAQIIVLLLKKDR